VSRGQCKNADDFIAYNNIKITDFTVWHLVLALQDCSVADLDGLFVYLFPRPHKFPLEVIVSISQKGAKILMGRLIVWPPKILI